MSGLLQHLKVSAIADGADSSQVQPSDWNAAHVFAGGNHGAIPVRDTGDATYGSNWLASVAAGQVLISNGIAALPSWTASPSLSSLTLSGQLNTGGIAFPVDGAALGPSIFRSANLLVIRGGSVSTLFQSQNGTFTTAELTDGGLLTVSGFGVHSFSAGGSGTQILQIVNPIGGAGSSAALYVGTNASVATTFLQSLSNLYTTSGASVADGSLLGALGVGGLSIAAMHASGAIRFYSGGQTVRAQINANGTQRWPAYGAGTMTLDASGNITAVSDARLKDRLAPLPYGLAEILRLKPVQHGYTAASALDRDHLYGGFLAQDVGAVIPIAVGRNADGYLTLADRPILGAVVHAIQTLAARLAHLEQSVTP